MNELRDKIIHNVLETRFNLEVLNIKINALTEKIRESNERLQKLSYSKKVFRRRIIIEEDLI